MYLVSVAHRYLEVQCVAGLRKLHDPKLAIAAKLTSLDGEECVGKMAEAHADLQSTSATNDPLAEGTFGTYKSVRRQCPGLGMQKSSAISQSVISKHMATDDAVLHRVRKARTQTEQRLGVRKPKPAPSGMGYFNRLPHLEQKALIDMARSTRKEMRALDQADETEVGARSSVVTCHTCVCPTSTQLPPTSYLSHS